MQESRGAIAESDLPGKWTADTNGADCENYKKRLGNLILLVRPIDIVARNDFYELKTPAYKKAARISRGASLTGVGKNSSITRINEKLEAFSARNAKSIRERHDLLIALAKDIWKTAPLPESRAAPGYPEAIRRLGNEGSLNPLEESR